MHRTSLQVSVCVRVCLSKFCHDGTDLSLGKGNGVIGQPLSFFVPSMLTLPLPPHFVPIWRSFLGSAIHRSRISKIGCPCYTAPCHAFDGEVLSICPEGPSLPTRTYPPYTNYSLTARSVGASLRTVWRPIGNILSQLPPWPPWPGIIPSGSLR